MNVPRVLYKFFTEERFARDLVERGKTRVGTLYDFRHTDGWDELRGDSEEGQFTYSLTSDAPELITPESAPGFLKPLIEAVGTPIASYGGTLHAVAHHPDSFVYCTTELDNSQGMKSYGEFGVVIHDVESFFRIITTHLTDDLQLAAREPHGFAAPCAYTDRQVRLTDSRTDLSERPIAFLKPLTKSSEREVRGIWHPINPPDAYVDIICLELRDCCGWLEALRRTGG